MKQNAPEAVSARKRRIATILSCSHDQKQPHIAHPSLRRRASVLADRPGPMFESGLLECAR